MKKLSCWILAFFMFFCLPAYAKDAKKMADLLPRNPCIFDIGANIGDKTLQYLSLKPSRVVCVEPIPDCVRILQERFKHLQQVFIVPECVSDYIGEITFFINEQSSVLSTADEDWKLGRFKGLMWGQSIVVPTITIDELVARYGVPDFCKIDVEGYELHVLKGMTKPIPYLSFEFASEYLEKKTRPCLEYLHSLGYRYFNVAIGGTEKFNETKKWVDKETLYTYLKNHPDPLCWGDIYARLKKPRH